MLSYLLTLQTIKVNKIDYSFYKGKQNLSLCLIKQHTITLFICGLFNDTFISSDYITLNERMMNELERMWNEAVVAKFRVLYWNLPGKTKEIHENFQWK
jgi:hypothetical protein